MDLLKKCPPGFLDSAPPIHPFDFSLPTCKVLGHPLIRRRLQQYRLLWGGATVARVNLWLVWLVRLLMMQHCDTMWIPLSLDPIGLFNKQTAFHWTAFPPDISLTDWCIREVRGLEAQGQVNWKLPTFLSKVEIYSTQSAFLAVKAGSGQCWGNTAEGGECSSATWQNVSRVCLFAWGLAPSCSCCQCSARCCMQPLYDPAAVAKYCSIDRDTWIRIPHSSL